MAIEYVPLTAHDPEDGEALGTVEVKAMVAFGMLRLTIKESDEITFREIDICLSAEDIRRAWDALRPEGDW
jgi:hypothetical protein